jgi:2-haloacid dehalogenase
MNQSNTLPGAIVFDFGGVLIDWDPRYLYRKIFAGDSAAVERFLAEVDFFSWNRQQDGGRPFSVAIAELCRQFPQHADLIRAYDQRYLESLAGPIQPSLAILHALKQAGWPLYGLSNWPAEKFALVRPKYAFFDWFEDILISGEVGLAKPDPRIYQLFLARSGRKAGECLFIDDSAHNLVTAGQLGFTTLLFTSPDQLAHDLHQLGLLV